MVMDEDNRASQQDPDRPPQPPAAGPRPPKPKGVWPVVFMIGSVVLLVILFRTVLVEGPAELDDVSFETELERGTVKSFVLTGDMTARGDFTQGGKSKNYEVRFSPGYLQSVRSVTKEPPTEGSGPEKERHTTNLDYIKTKLPKSDKESGFKNEPADNMWTQVLLQMVPWVLFIGLIWFLFFRQIRASSGPGSVLSFGRSQARKIEENRKKYTFKDVAGIDEAKDEVTEIIEFLKNSARFQKLGARIPRGVLLVGPPGTGKTLLAKAIAGEADVPFFSISGSDFVEMFVGVGASRVRDLFRQAKASAPCIIFLDEIDAVGRRRGSGLGGGHDEREQTLNAILVEMDGFDTNDGVIVMAATNRPDVLDSALLRPGRFDREIVIDLPDVKGREAILKVHARKIVLDPAVDLSVLARTTPIFSGADLEALINEAALLAVMRKKQMVTMDELEEARDKVQWGRQKKSRAMDESDKRITAFHEAGHSLLAKLIPGVDPMHKVTIIPRGIALGATLSRPEKDRYHMQRNYALGNMTVLFGGRVAEELFCDDISAGARNDIKRATELARLMVCEWGMSEKLGPVNYSETEEHLFLGREIARTRNHSEAISVEIDVEVRRLIDECYGRAKKLVETNKGCCEEIAKTLLVREVLTAAEVDEILKKHGVSPVNNSTAGDRAPSPGPEGTDAGPPAAGTEGQNV
ncbi:MAG: ATP-dependent zinc metalloprotease FtsH [Planctomycetota bacterium]|nr:ATP-dependent zinc metalloprotease FtsH [Planctomycetota bacterium]